MRALIALLLLATTLGGCTFYCHDMDADNGCRNTYFVVKGCCSGTTVYDLDPAFALGDSITLNGVTHFNAIQIAGKYDSDLHVKLRPFNPDTDWELLATNCACFTAEPWSELPIFVIVDQCATTEQ